MANTRIKRAQAERGRPASKSAPMSFRMDDETRGLVDRAAGVVGQNRTDFMLTALREKAAEVLLDQRLFVLNNADWDAFAAHLDEAPPPNAKLKALLARVPAWDR
jgi:uncharacterized protein (DUF1778 family)